MEKIKTTQSGYPILIISLCSFFLFYKYILQIYPSIITDSLMREFALNGVGLGSLAATFYYTYMIAQLFVGVMIDKYSPRWLTSVAIFCCALGVLLFAGAHTVMGAGLSRGLMGVGVAFATVAYMKLAAVWFPPRHYAFIGGLLATAAMAGAVFGEAPLAWFVAQFGWRDCLLYIGWVGMGLAVLFFLVVRDAPNKIEIAKKSDITWRDVGRVLKNTQNWLLTLYSGLAFCPIAVFGGLWGTPFLQQAYELNKTQSASMVSMIFIGLGIGSPLLGLLSDKVGKRRVVMWVCTLLSCVMLSIVLYCHPLPVWLLGTLLFLFGFGLGSFMLVFSIGKELNDIRVTATVIAMINASDAFLDALTEPAIGWLLDLGWEGKIHNGVHYFSLSSYHVALAVLPIYLFAAAILLIWIKDR